MKSRVVHFLAGDYDLHNDAYARLQAFAIFFTVAAARHARPFDDLEAIALATDGPGPGAIQHWTQANRQVGPWVEPTAIETACVWRADDERRAARVWCVETIRGLAGTPSVPASYVALVPPPDPLRERRSDWLKRASREWEQRATVLQTIGFKPTRKKTNATHFEWLADYLFGGESIPNIARDAQGRDRKTVSLGIHRLADLIQLQLPEQSS